MRVWECGGCQQRSGSQKAWTVRWPAECVSRRTRGASKHSRCLAFDQPTQHLAIGPDARDPVAAFGWQFSGKLPAGRARRLKPMSTLGNPVYRFAGFTLEPAERRLSAAGKAIALTPKVFDTLVLLVERAGHVISKGELMKELWPRGYVDERISPSTSGSSAGPSAKAKTSRASSRRCRRPGIASSRRPLARVHSGGSAHVCSRRTVLG